MIKLGRYGVEYKGDPEAYVRQYVEEGYAAIYAPPLMPGDPAITALVQATAKAGLVIGEAGAWRNLIAHDEAARKANLQFAVDTLAAADEMGVQVVHLSFPEDGSTMGCGFPKHLRAW